MSVLEEAKKLLNPKYEWDSFFKDNWSLLEKVESVIQKKESIFYPNPEDVFKIYRRLKPDQIKVVILGQDPYHNLNDEEEPVAMGFAFSIRKCENPKINPSLRNIFKVIEKTTGTPSKCINGDLTPWVKQGVFLLNSCLTVSPNTPGSHGKIWDGFIKRTLSFIHKNSLSTFDDEDSDAESQDNKDLLPISLLWGRHAQEYKSECTGHVLMTSHPSPFSASNGFLDCDHFNQVNKILKKRGEIIIW